MEYVLGTRGHCRLWGCIGWATAQGAGNSKSFCNLHQGPSILYNPLKQEPQKCVVYVYEKRAPISIYVWGPIYLEAGITFPKHFGVSTLVGSRINWACGFLYLWPHPKCISICMYIYIYFPLTDMVIGWLQPQTIKMSQSDQAGGSDQAPQKSGCCN